MWLGNIVAGSTELAKSRLAMRQKRRIGKLDALSKGIAKQPNFRALALEPYNS